MKTLVDRIREDLNPFKTDMTIRLSVCDILKLIQALDIYEKALKMASKSIAHSEDFVNEQIRKIWPDQESCCECEYACSCKFPDGFLELESHQYHCAGSQIQIDEYKEEVQELLKIEGE